ncbi:MAG: PorT family protein [Muribaculaceae bacterium]|nr:PorT family protein [Muribaculaceae bacterium]
MRHIAFALVLVISIFLPGKLSAQTHYESHVHVGVHGGMAMSRITFTPAVKQKMLNDFTFGVAARYAEERHVGLMGEINVTRRGWCENFEESPLQYSRTMTYLEMPIMTHIFFGPRNFKFFFNLGPQFCYMLSSAIDSNFDYANPTSVEGFPTDNRMTEQMTMKIKNKFDYGICASFGLEPIIGRRNSFTLEARYYFGLGNIYGAAKKDTFSSSRGMAITVTLGYLFRLK